MYYKKLLEPASIGKMELRNRVVMGPIGTSCFDENHDPTQRVVDYYAERAKGGVGLIIVEHVAVQLVGCRSPKSPCMYSWDSLDKWKKLVDAVHLHGAKIGVELGHLGRCTDFSRMIGMEAQAPSALRCHHLQEKTRAVKETELQQFKEDYVNAVKIAVAAGFDTIELHFTNGYFIAEWISGRTNKRTDRYGGNLNNRMRLCLELIRDVRAEVGPDYPLLARLAAKEPNGGRGIEETRVLAHAFEEAGVDCLDINAGSVSDYDWEFPSFYKEQGFLLEDIEKIKRSVSIPVIGGGRILEPLMAERALEENRLDFVEVNRGNLADPYWVKKVAEGREDTIRRCVGCTRCINDKEKDGLVCTVNPYTCHEQEWKLTPAKEKKRVLIVGGGCAGLQAACTAAQRGHQVVLAEKDDELGGLVRTACVPPLKWDLAGLISALAAEAEESGVKILTGKTVTAGWIREEKFDEVLLATGFVPLVPPIPNDGAVPMCTAVELLDGSAWVGEKVAVLGGGMVGCECADFLAEYGKSITIFEMMDSIARDAFWNIRDPLMEKLKHYDVKINAGSKALEIKNGMIRYEKDGMEEMSGPFDAIVYALGLKPSLTLAKELDKQGIRWKNASGDQPLIQNNLVTALKTALEI